MKISEIVGAFLAGIVTIAALSLIVAPDSQMAKVVESLGSAAGNLITVAKAYPATR